MSTPLKRVCHQTVRHTKRCSQQTHPPSTRCLSTTPSHHANIQLPQDPEYISKDISSLAHAELETHRELRRMARTAAWEMPLLSQLSRPYEAPDKQQQPLRWRYTTYMGESHPASRKVVVEFKLGHLNTQTLPRNKRDKFIKLLGPRYNPETGMVKMSCESFETQAQNKRYLGDVIQELLAEARDPNADSFEDVPVDTRHVKRKVRLSFPKEWLLTAERKAELERRRGVMLLAEGRRVEEGTVVSGVQAIAQAEQDAKKQEQAAAREAALLGAEAVPVGAVKVRPAALKGRAQRAAARGGGRGRF